MTHYKTKHISEFSKEQLEKLAANEQLIDVRHLEEYELGHINNAILHPVENITTFNHQKNKTYYVYCKSGNRSVQASEYLTQHGYEVVNLDGGYTSFRELNIDSTQSLDTGVKDNRKIFNYSQLQCPGPIVNISKEIKRINVGEQIEVTVTDFGFLSDIKSWAKQTGHTLVKLDEYNDYIQAIIQKENPKDKQVNRSMNGTTIVLFSGELDKAMAALIIANGARAAGKDVTIFFTFWGLNALKNAKTAKVKKKGIAKLFNLILPSTPTRMPISKMNMFGLGSLMMKRVMKQKNVDSLSSLIEQAVDQNIKLIACTMSMDVMGISKEDLIDSVEYGGVGTYIGDTEQSNHNLFI
ncbi:DsrE/DsrF/DrsH-like family protein [Staphylococcus schweitzeri]|uniref:DsrE/DsrF/DrsH-like family protein n=1 Tax=Staphylococcus schweitzeri TaxID=1654388 RepID=UPI0005058D1D|nr:DsrE/DsrF/DrsH-like family protein [Staphylococcus schweitzeri]CDR66417.1 rhodanese-like domain-containing protein [Staphylococcus schweitzeri]